MQNIWRRFAAYPFTNEPLVELRRAPQRAALMDALAGRW